MALEIILLVRALSIYGLIIDSSESNTIYGLIEVRKQWKPVFFASSQLVARSLNLHEIFSVVFTNIELFNGIRYIGTYGMLSLLRCGKKDCTSH